MIEKLTHVPIVVSDQEKALKFYTEVLGFEKRADYQNPGNPRWLTVAPKGTDVELILFEGKYNLDPRVPPEGRRRPACVPKPRRQDAHPGIRDPLLQRPSPPPGLHVRSPALRHRRQGRQPAERGPRPVQLDPAQPGQAASRQAPGVAELGRCGNQAPPGEVGAEAQTE